MRAALEDVGAQKADGPDSDQSQEDRGVDTEHSTDCKDAPVEKYNAEFDDADGEDTDDGDDPSVLLLVSLEDERQNLEVHTLTLSWSCFVMYILPVSGS